jgi:TRAP-type C4-dicarboxylate transport system permease small subunit
MICVMAKGNKFRWDIYLVELASRVGVFGTIVISLLSLFIIKGSAAQHKEFIDKFFLLKWGQGASFYFCFIIVCLIVILLVQYLYFKLRIKIKEERISELTNERDRLQNKLLKKL